MQKNNSDSLSLLPTTWWSSRAIIILLYLPTFHYGLFGALISATGYFEWDRYLRHMLGLHSCFVFLFILVSLLDFLVAPRLPFDQSQTRWFVAKYYLSGSIAAILSVSLLEPYMPDPRNNQGSPIVFLLFHVSWMTALAGALHAFIRKSQSFLTLEKNFKTVQYNALKSQLNPHFLFNTLNMISAEIDFNPAKANLLLEELSDLLRGVLNASSQRLVPLKQEVELLEHYLYIQKKRFEERLQFNMNIPKECDAILVPPLLLQPLVENSLKHGLASSKKQGILNINAKKEGEYLEVSVQDNGSGFDTDGVKWGHGLTIIQDTLPLLFGSRQEIKIDSIPGVGTTIKIKIPLDFQ